MSCGRKWNERNCRGCVIWLKYITFQRWTSTLSCVFVCFTDLRIDEVRALARDNPEWKTVWIKTVCVCVCFFFPIFKVKINVTGSEKTAHFAQNMKLRYRQKHRVGHRNWKTFLFVHTNLKPFAYLLTNLKCQWQVFHGERVVRNAALLFLLWSFKRVFLNFSEIACGRTGETLTAHNSKTTDSLLIIYGSFWRKF